MMQPQTTARNKSKQDIKNYNLKPNVEAPTGAAEPPQARSIQSQKFCYLQRVSTHAPLHMMQPQTKARNKSKQYLEHLLLRSS
jgi:hypothetical protein